MATSSSKDRYRVNYQIRVPEVRVIDQDGQQLGVMSSDEARTIAEEKGLDLVEVAPTARPPVCRIMDFGKFQYERKKQAQAQRKAQIETKTITLRPKTDTHDLETKLRHARKFLLAGNRVKFVMRLRGRERANPKMWTDKLDEILDALTELSTITQRPMSEGRAISAMVEPRAGVKLTPQTAAAVAGDDEVYEDDAEDAAEEDAD